MAIQEFLEYVFEGSPKGYFALSLFKHNVPVKERFLEWPTQRKLLTDRDLLSTSKDGDLYFTPALFKVPSRQAEHALGAHVAWVDQDTLVTGPSTCPPAGLRVASGSAGHEHAYWRSERFLKPWEVERWNDKNALLLGADKSGWDITQLLRLPGTFNWKTNPPKSVIHLNGSGKVFEVPTLEKLLPFGSFVHVADLQKKPLDDYTQQLIDSTPSDRSKAYWELGCRLRERDWLPSEIRSLLELQDAKWGKFSSRSDKGQRLDELVTRIFERRPRFTVTDFDPSEIAPLQETQPDTTTVESEDESGSSSDLRTTPRGFLSLRRTAVQIEWVIPGILRTRGLLYLAGPTGVGKSTFASNLAASLALNKPEWAGFEIEPSEQKILYGSHEMDESEIMFFLEPMLEKLPDELLARLEERLHFVTYGQSIPLDEPKQQKAYEKLIAEGKYTGFIIDTLGASTSTSLQDEGNTRKIADWLDKIRQKYGVWVTVLAHPRKAPAGVKNHQYALDDMYGSRIFGDRANTVLFMQPTKHRDAIELRSEKTRFTSGTKHRYLKRDANHWLTVAENYTTSTTAATQPSRMVASITELEDSESDLLMRGTNDDLGLE